MKKQAYTVIALLILVGSMALAAQAQSSSHGQLTANIPFQFNVGDQTMPAGEYTISQINPSSDPAVLQLRIKDGSARALIQMNNAIGKANQSARIVFNRYGSRYYLSQLWTPLEANGLQARKTKAEGRMSRELAATQSASETVALRTR